MQAGSAHRPVDKPNVQTLAQSPEEKQYLLTPGGGRPAVVDSIARE